MGNIHGNNFKFGPLVHEMSLKEYVNRQTTQEKD